ncbi:MAG: sulfatase [Planctomycetota bacterium]
MARRWGIARRGTILRGLGPGAAAGILLAACGRVAAGTDAAPGVLVIAIDGLRADHVGAYGYDRPTTPTLDRLAAEGLHFAQAFANSPSLLPSHVSLLTGGEPFVARRYLPAEIDLAVERRWHLPAAVPRLAVEFLAHGHDTAAFVDHPHLAPVFGFDVGFERYVESAGKEAGATHLCGELMEWLRGVARDRPWFAYLHLHDLERAWSAPDPAWERYFPPRPGMEDVPPVGTTDDVFFAVPFSRWRGGSRSLGEYEALYDGHLRRLDEAIDRLLGSLAATRRLDSTTIVVVGSHGVQFGEAGMLLAAGRYSMADLHVPWILRPRPGLALAHPPGAAIETLASLSDLAPTLLELAGIAVPRGMHGVSQAAEVTGPSPERARRTYAFASCGIQEGGVLVGERYCYEFLLPGEVETPILRRSWFGEGEGHEAARQIRFYDRLAHPFPSLGEGLREGTPAEFRTFVDAAVLWYEDMELLRRVLQPRSVSAEPVSPEKVERLREKGLLAGK